MIKSKRLRQKEWDERPKSIDPVGEDDLNYKEYLDHVTGTGPIPTTDDEEFEYFVIGGCGGWLSRSFIARKAGLSCDTMELDDQPWC